MIVIRKSVLEIGLGDRVAARTRMAASNADSISASRASYL